VSPFHYFPALSIVAGDAPFAGDVTVLIATAAVCAIGAYLSFNRRDL
jgi:hypothetical protein